MEVLAYASIRDEEVHAKTVEVLAYASIKDKEVDAKTAKLNVDIYSFFFNSTVLLRNVPLLLITVINTPCFIAVSIIIYTNEL